MGCSLASYNPRVVDVRCVGIGRWGVGGGIFRASSYVWGRSHDFSPSYGVILGCGVIDGYIRPES